MYSGRWTLQRASIAVLVAWGRDVVFVSGSAPIAIFVAAVALALLVAWYLNNSARAKARGQVEPAESIEGPVEAPVCSFVHPEDVVFDTSASTREDAIRLLSATAVGSGIARDAETLTAAFLEREAEGTTGMTDGFAIPHAKSDCIDRAAVLVLKNDAGITGWDTMDERPVRVAIALLIPGGRVGADHLRILSRVAESLMDEAFRLEVKSAGDPVALAAAINARLA